MIITVTSTPYNIPVQTQCVAVDTSSQSIRVNLPAAASTGVSKLLIYDKKQNCKQYPISVFPDGAVQSKAPQTYLWKWTARS